MTNYCPPQDTSQNHLEDLAIPPDQAVPEYFSKLSPSTPINIPLFAAHLHDHPDLECIDNLLTALSKGFRIGFQGSRIPKEYPNLLSTQDKSSIIYKNFLKDVELVHTAGPFTAPPFPNPFRLTLKNTYLIGVPFFTCPTPNTTPQVSMLTLVQPIFPCIISLWIMPFQSFRTEVQVVSCSSWISNRLFGLRSAPFIFYQVMME